MKKTRVRNLSKPKKSKGAIVYWMSRDQRVNDNWALIFAQDMAIREKLPMMVIFCLIPSFLGATLRQYDFMLSGLEQIHEKLTELNIPFKIMSGFPQQEIPKFIDENDVGCLITDFSPLRIKRNWIKSIKEKLTIHFYEVDTHNIIPCWTASPKREYAAYTFRPKVRKLLPQYLDEFPPMKKMPDKSLENDLGINWEGLKKHLKIDPSVLPINWIQSGEKAAAEKLKNFMKDKLADYDALRNDPNKNGQSELSPYLHFGQISAQRIVLELNKIKKNGKSKNAFLEELVVRRELSDNFCFYTPEYDKFDSFPPWAKQTLKKHEKDKREYLYSLDELEGAKTHDDAWNAAQIEMVTKGKMHGYMRMYWGKKILEWTKTPEKALEIALYLNDKYEIDGRDPNGYVGVAWSIGGVHDRAWKEREIFGKVRYMSYDGLKRKFNLKQYIERYINKS
ncbi:MAG: deoxyribodipyrimidine photo-lyase [Promethearchaeota archaeon]|nr:MAG: deoxyribodipyrimidine photo-lyase [Candidatus Lokiarchaeota archaeon]